MNILSGWSVSYATMILRRIAAGGALTCSFVMYLLLVPGDLKAQTKESAIRFGGVNGRVVSEATGAALQNAIIEVYRDDWSGGTVTDGSGRYAVADVPTGRSRVRVRHIGHATLELEIVVAAGREVALDVALPVQPVALSAVRVNADGVSARADSISVEGADLGIVGARVLQASPGLAELGLADAVRGIPGQEPPDPGSVLYVRGATADLKLVYLDGAPVYAPFPLGGLMDPFSPELLHQADVYLGGAPARYDGGLSYVMDLRTRGGESRGFSSKGSMDLLSARVMAEAGIDDRFSAIGAVRAMHTAATGILFNDPMPYGYQEGFLRADAQIGATGLLSVTGFTNSEEVRMGVTPISGDSTIEWGNRAGSVRLRGMVGETAAELTLARGDYRARLPIAGKAALVADGKARRSRFSADFTRRIDSTVLRYGGSFDRQYQRASAGLSLGDTRTRLAEGVGDVVGVYGEAAGQLGTRVRLRGGLRIDHFSTTSEVTLAPRVAATWMVSERVALTVAGGQYHQFLRPPEEILLLEPEALDALSGPPLIVGSASHFTVGLDQDLGEGSRFGLEAYFKNFADVPGGYSAEASASGMDFWVRREEGVWTGWLGYSLAWVWSSSQPTTQTQANFTGRHLLSAGLGSHLGERTRIDVSVAYGTGLPYSAIPVGQQELAFASSERAGSVTSADRGGTETAPLLHSPDGPYLRLDASLSQLWQPRRGNRVFEIKPYVRVLNSLGQRDALFYYFDRNSEEGARAIGSLPIVPVVGLEWKL